MNAERGRGWDAARLGARQQTVSQWETGASRPRGMSRRLLQLVAEEAGFYRAEAAAGDSGVSEGRRGGSSRAAPGAGEEPRDEQQRDRAG